MNWSPDRAAESGYRTDQGPSHAAAQAGGQGRLTFATSLLLTTARARLA